MNYIASDASMFCSASGIAALLFCADFALTSNQLAKAELTRAAVLEQSVCLVAGYQHDSTVSAECHYLLRLRRTIIINVFV